MVTSGIIDIDPETNRFSLPTEHAAFPNSRSWSGQYRGLCSIHFLWAVLKMRLCIVLTHGGGVPYSRYPRFHEVMSEDSTQSVLSTLESHIIPLVPGLKEQLQKGIKVLDVGCGMGRMMIQLGAAVSK